MAKRYLAMKPHSGMVKIGGKITKINLPEGCTGIMFVFKTKKSARDFFGKDIPLVEIEEEK